MARFDLHRAKPGLGYLLIVQSHFHDGLSSRVVVPVLPRNKAPPGSQGLNPEIAIAGEPHLLFPQYLSSIPKRELGVLAGNLEVERDAITRALDLLFTGF